METISSPFSLADRKIELRCRRDCVWARRLAADDKLVAHWQINHKEKVWVEQQLSQVTTLFALVFFVRISCLPLVFLWFQVHCPVEIGWTRMACFSHPGELTSHDIKNLNSAVM